MQTFGQHNPVTHPTYHLVVDMRDCYTWSFPEFVPFCAHLFYYSSFKAFGAITFR